jgi:glycosyltransferase involved in cell wall biosynthesis
LKIAVACSVPLDVRSGSGTAVAVREIRAALVRRGHVVDTIAPRAAGPSLTLRRWWFNRSLNPARLSRSEVVLGVDGDAWRAARAAGRPYVAVLKGIYPEVLPYESGLTRRLLQVQAGWERAATAAATAVVVPSRYSAEAVRRHYGTLAERVHVVPEPFDLAAWRARLPAGLGREGTVLCVAHLYPRKRIPDLLAAWPLLLRERQGSRLRVVGHGPGLAEVRRLAARLGGVSVEGHLPRQELMRAFATSSVFALPSAQENFGIAAVEAMASGLAVVAGDAGALPETTEGAVRELVPIGDVESLARALGRTLDESVQRRAEVTNPAVAARYDPASVGDRLEAVLRAVPR